ncbi:MAG TPA: ABC transporter ATP-binding protein [Virgibacillus sp.]|nr:ABC transporter ATP-binding protein [Virgibacillus sp.]
MALLTVKNLTKKYGHNIAVNNISFQFQAGRCVALIGPNGAGKTTTLRTLAGLMKPTSGTIHFAPSDSKDDIRSRIGYLPQYPVFYSWMTGMEFLVYSGELTFLSKAEAQQRAETLLKQVGIFADRNKRISKYSGGMKQRLGIAQAIIHRPQLLMLDEPVSSLDPIGRREVLTLLEELKTNMTILFSTHILADVDEISDDLLLLHRGEILESGLMAELRRNYQSTKISLAFESDLDYYQMKVDGLSSVTTSSIERNRLHVSVVDRNIARHEILNIAAEEKWPVTDFIVDRTSLEDMFLKVVGK